MIFKLIDSKIYDIVLNVFLKRFFGHYGNKIKIDLPLQIFGKEHIYIESNVRIGFGLWLSAIKIDEIIPKVMIGEGTSIGNFNHIICTNEIKIESNVLIADKVYISDNLHGYEDINTPIIKQPVRQKRKVFIGSGTWIGECVSIIGVSIGKNCVIGANSVVTKDIPDYSVVVGNPGRIIKSYNSISQKWEKVV